MEPLWWQWIETEADGRAAGRCDLCFHRCRIPVGGTGYCGVRGVDDGGLASPGLGRFCSVAVDPIEKKPLHHWQPGTRIFSLGGLGCTMRCPFCQNHSIAQPQDPIPLTAITVEGLAARVRGLGLTSVAYTYNEPTLAAEYILAAAPVLKDVGAATVLVTNGLMSPAVLADLIPWVAAANVDVKTFNPAAYARLGGSLEAVQRTVTSLVLAGVHVELTTLVVPGLSDSPEELEAEVEWIAGLDPNIPLHLSRYFPAHRYAAPPTDTDLLRRFQALAKTRLKRVHLGNMR